MLSNGERKSVAWAKRRADDNKNEFEVKIKEGLPDLCLVAACCLDDFAWTDGVLLLLLATGPLDEWVLLLLLLLLEKVEVIDGEATLAVDVAVGLHVVSLTGGGRSA